MKVLITGASGFLGGNLVREINKRNPQWGINILCRNNGKLEYIKDIKYNKHFGDLTDKASLLKAIEGIDIIFHCAALFTLDDDCKDELYQVNLDGTRNVFEAALAKGVKKIVYTGTAATTGWPIGNGKMADETIPFNKWETSNEYSRSKYKAEKLALQMFKENNLPVVILNPIGPVGPGDTKPTPTGQYIIKCLQKKVSYYMEGVAHFVHISDVVNAHLKAVENGRNGEKYILGTVNAKMSDIFKWLSEVSGIDCTPPIRVPLFAAYTGGICFDLAGKLLGRKIGPGIASVKYASKTPNYDFSKARNELKMSQTPLKQAFKEAYEWFQQNGYLN